MENGFDVRGSDDDLRRAQDVLESGHVLKIKHVINIIKQPF